MSVVTLLDGLTISFVIFTSIAKLCRQNFLVTNLSDFRAWTILEHWHNLLTATMTLFIHPVYKNLTNDSVQHFLSNTFTGKRQIKWPRIRFWLYANRWTLTSNTKIYVNKLISSMTSVNFLSIFHFYQFFLYFIYVTNV